MPNRELANTPTEHPRSARRRRLRLSLLLAGVLSASCSSKAPATENSSPDGSAGSAGSGASDSGSSLGGGKGTGGTGTGGKATGGSSTGGSSTGGNGTGGGSATGGSTSNYDPCPPKGTPCVIMPFGDSITYGDHGDNTTDGGYRPRLFHLALANSQSITFVGQGSNGPDTVDGVAFPKYHDGFPGFSIDGGGAFPGITDFAAAHIATYKPQIVTLMIGTNDVAFQIDLVNAPTRLGRLLDVILGADPKLLLVVAQITPSKYDDAFDARARTYNAAIPALVKSRADAGKHIILVDMYTAFTSNTNYKSEYLNDVVHPTQVGYDKLGDTWYAAIGALFH